MKKIKLFTILSILFFSTSCNDYLEITPENSVTYTNYFNTVQDAEALLSDMEYKLRRMAGAEAEDLYYTKPHRATGVIADLSYTLGVFKNMTLNYYTEIYVSWGGYYQCINAADLIIQNAHRFPLPKEVIEPYVLQAKFAKGLMYFWLAQGWGEVPIIVNNTEYVPLPKNPTIEVLECATRNALEAFNGLAVYEEIKDGYGNPRTTKQFAGKGAAAALLAHIYAWRAAVENKAEYWEQSEEYCRKIIDHEVGNFQLAASPEKVCMEVMKGESTEGIWETYRPISSGEVRGEPYYEVSLFKSFPVIITKKPTDFMMEQQYRTSIDSRYEKTDRRRDAYYFGLDAEEFYYVHDAKINQTVVKYTERNGDDTSYYRLNYDDWSREKVNALLENEGDRILDGSPYKNPKAAFLFKHRFAYYRQNNQTQQPVFVGYDMNTIVWRLADIILLRAECRAYQKKDALAIADLNRIRERAYGNNQHNYPSARDREEGLDSDLTLAIFREREKELMFEDKRYYDIVRNGMNTFNGHGSYDYVRQEIGNMYGTLSEQDIKDGALYMGVYNGSFYMNDLITQNIYWNKRAQ